MRYRSTIQFCIVIFLSVFLLACDSPDVKYQKYIERGNTYLEEGDLIRARLEFRNAAKIMPAEALPLFKLGLIEEAEGQLSSALSAFLVAEQQNREFEPVLLKLAEFFLTARQHEQARTRIESLLTIRPEHIKAKALNASVALAQGDLAQAQKNVDLVLKAEPSNIIAASVQTGIHLARDNQALAIKTLNRAIEQHPEEISLYLLKAAIFSEQNNFSAVADTYQQIFAIRPETIQFRFDLAKVLKEAGQIEKAGAVYKETVKLFPDNEQAKSELANYLEDRRGAIAAEQEIVAFIEQEPDKKIFHLWLAELYVRNQENQKAIETLKNILDSDPDETVSLNANTTLAQIELTQGAAERASQLIDQVLEQDINNEEALFLKAKLAFSQGDNQKAVAELRSILQSNPANAQASRILAEALLQQGRIDLAIDTLLQTVKRHSDNQSALVRLAQLYALRGEDDAGLEILKNVTDTDPTYAIAWESTARLAIAKGFILKADNAITRLKERPGQQIIAEYLKGQLNEKEGYQDAAIEKYQFVIASDPNAPIANFALSSLLQLSETKEQLNEVKDFLLSLDDENARIFTVLGAIERTLEDTEAAEIAFRNAIRLDPTFQDPYISLSEMSLVQERPEEALAILKQAEENIPADHRASLIQAGILTDLGQIDEALTIYKTILDKSDQLDVVANNYAHIIADYKFEDSEMLEDARITAERFINSNNPYFLDTLGWVYTRLGLYTQARPILARAIELLESPNHEIEYHYGKVLFELGQLDRAHTHLANAIQGDGYVGVEDANQLYQKTAQTNLPQN